MSKTSPGKRRTQAERREASRQAVLDSACRLFGEKGYADTSLEEIAADCGLTIRPIYHYFGNKKALFAAVNDVMEQRIIDSLVDRGDVLENWHAYLALCDDPGFRRIVLVDSPNVLGRERWASSVVTQRIRDAMLATSGSEPRQQFRAELMFSVVMGAFAEAALTVAEADDLAMAKEEAEALMVSLFGGSLRR